MSVCITEKSATVYIYNALNILVVPLICSWAIVNAYLCWEFRDMKILITHLWCFATSVAVPICSGVSGAPWQNQHFLCKVGSKL